MPYDVDKGDHGIPRGEHLRSRYDFHGITIETSCEDRDLADAAGRCFSFFRLEPVPVNAARPAFQLRIRGSETRALEPESGFVAQHERGARVFFEESKVTLKCGESEAHVDLGNGQAVVSVYRRPRSSVGPEFFDLVLLAFLSLLRSVGRHSLHCGAVVAPNDTCLLICGASGSGKSTLTLNLAAAGWDYLSDDVQVLFARGGGVVAQPLSRHFRLDPGVARLRALNDAVLGGVGKDGKVLVGQDGVLKGMFRDEARPSVLLFPRIEHADVSILRPIGDSDALLRLLTHFSVFGFSARHTREDLAMIRLLVQQCRSYEMSSGADVLKDPERVVELLADA